jgi:D-serine deaminase-like pyridoxal phosphate-dependent protein
MEDIAVRIYVTVVSVPSTEYAVIDGGTKTFPMDIPLDAPPYYYPGYALVEGNEDLQLRRMNEEHGIITSKKGDTGLKVGDKLALIPIHVCTAVNMQNQVYLYDGESLRQEKVAARGMLV